MKQAPLYFFLCCIAVAAVATAQEKPPDYGWQNTLVAGFNLSQLSLQNWVQGGEDMLAWSFHINGKAVLKQVDYAWTNTLKLTYGQTKLDGADFEKADDELFWESVYSRDLGWKIAPYAAVSARTQLAPGFKMIDGVRTQTSAFFDPGYLTQSVGFTYVEGETFSTRLGVAVKETFTSRFTGFGYADNPKTDEIEKIRVQTGIESATNLKVSVMENILYTSQLNLFSAFNQLDVWDVRWDNSLTGKVNDYINVSLNVLLIHEIAQSRRTQMKEVLAVGLSYTIF